MSRPETLPDFPEPAAWLLAACLAALWLSLRIRILRRRQAWRGPNDPPVRTWRWLRALARRTWILPTLAVVGVLCLAGAVAVIVG